jgi:hypothetical protein
MFGWSSPQSPLESPEKLWVERRMTWLAQTFGADRLKRAVIVLPTPEFFPDRYDGTEATAMSFYGRICSYMGVDPRRAPLRFFTLDGKTGGERVGCYVPGTPETVLVERDQLRDPASLAATLTHELARLLLIGEGRMSPDDDEQESVAGLLTVALGLGVFGANAVMSEGHERCGGSYRYHIARRGGLSERLFGYALALFTWSRGERRRPAWAGALRPNVREVFAQGLAYLVKTGDTQFKLSEPPPDADMGRRVAALAELLQSESSGARLAALCDLEPLGAAAGPAVGAVIPKLEVEDRHIRVKAAEVLAAVGALAGAAIPALLETAVRQEDTELRRAALEALGAIGRRPAQVVPTLLSLIQTNDGGLSFWAADALGRFGPAAAIAAEPLTKLLRKGNAAAAHPLAAVAGAAAVPALIEGLKFEATAAAAAVALGRLGRAAAAAAPPLFELVKSTDPGQIMVMDEALRQIVLPEEWEEYRKKRDVSDGIQPGRPPKRSDRHIRPK